MQDANFEDLRISISEDLRSEDLYFEDPQVIEDNSWNVHESNTHTLLIEIYKSKNNLSPPIMKKFFDLKYNRYDLRSKQLLKLPETSTSR